MTNRTKPTLSGPDPRTPGPHGKTLQMIALGSRRTPTFIHAHAQPLKPFERPAGMTPYVAAKPSRDRSLVGKARRRARRADAKAAS